jgi:hypothetical protein
MRNWPRFFIFAAAGATAPAQWLNYPTAGVPKNADGSANLNAPAPQTTGVEHTPKSGRWRRLRIARDSFQEKASARSS